MDRAARLQPLGPLRLRLLSCLGGDSPRTAGYFSPPSDADVVAAFHRHVATLDGKWRGQDASLDRLLTAARFLCGDVVQADALLAMLPAQPIGLDHGAGLCLVAHLDALTALPLPLHLGAPRQWTAGSSEQAEMRHWLQTHRAELRWSDLEGVYRI